MTRVLVIDDEAPIRLLCRVNLEAEGMSVLEAGDGPSGLEAARAGNPDVILLDVMMPGLDGWGVAEALLEDAGTAEIPIIFLTARAEFRDRARGLDIGGVDYITKPFNPVELAPLVRSLLERLERGERDELRREQRDRRRERDADPQAEPERLRAEPPRRLLLPRARGAAHLRGRPVLEEVEDREQRRQHDRADAERGELRAAEVPDDGGVDEDVRRLGRERAERRHGEPEDLAVVPGAELHSSRRMRAPEDCASAVTTISSTFTCGGRVTAKRTQSATSSGCIGPPSATFS